MTEAKKTAESKQGDKPVVLRTSDNQPDNKNNASDQSDEVTQSADVQAADAAGVSEGEVKALRSDAGLNQGAGHEANIGAWEASADGQAFLDTEGDRNDEAEKGAEAAAEPLDDDGQSEAEKKYAETVGKG